ncbi:MAG: PQQ-dependent sugar dehydrogenase [Litoreibacter sp.]
MRKQTFLSFITLAIFGVVGPAQAIETSVGSLNVAKVVDNLDQPWAIEFLPSKAMLITEREGEVVLIGADGNRRMLSGVPDVVAKGQGGLLDVMVPRDFATSSEIFFSAAIKQGNGSGTALIRAKLDEQAATLSNIEVVFQQTKGFSAAKHFGSRLVEARDGSIFMTIGERGTRPAAQDLTNHNGTVVRVLRSGAVPSDNPFVGHQDARPEIYSYGHRNPQGAALDLKGDLWINEHGARGGDEVNKINPGANYGWPAISYGTHYSGAKIGQGTAAPKMEQPAYYWDPSIAPSGMMIYSGKLWPEWKGDIFVGSLKFDYISRLEGGTFSEEKLTSSETGRVRDIVEGPEGAIYFLSINDGALYQITP